ncbi:MAG: hypothetical protein HW402_826, partial [Dehalococcoidales bacterium]|nr:hypothetical protein [Dehalococcoidales bacterium]
MKLHKNIKHLIILLTTILGATLMLASQSAFAAGGLPSQQAANERMSSGEITTQVPDGRTVSDITNNGGAGPIDHYSVSSINSTQMVGVVFSVTIQAQDASSNNITSGSDETVNMTFGKPDAGATPRSISTTNGTATLVNMTMTVAQTSENITFTGVSSNKTGTSNSFDVNAGAITKLAFTIGAQTLTAGAVSSNMTIQTRDFYSNSSNVSSNTIVNLTSSSANGTFYSDAGGTANITSLTISSGSNSASFYYKDTVAGTPTITAAESPSQGWADANQPETVNAGAITKLAFTTSVQTLTAGVVSSNMTIQTRDFYSNSANVSSNTPISLTSTSANGTFYSDAGGTANITSLTISSGSNSASFYYKDTVAGTPTITAAESPSQGWTDATQSETVNIGPIHHYAVSSITSPQRAGVAFSVTIQAQDASSQNITSGSDASENVTFSFGKVDAGATPLFANTTSGTATVSMTLTVVQVSENITFTGVTSGKTGTSNSFDVNTGPIHHYSVSPSPIYSQIAGSTFSVTIQAQDVGNNNITSGSDEAVTITLGLVDTSATPGSTVTTSGTVTVSMTMWLVQDGQSIIFTGVTSGKTGTSNVFNVNAVVPVTPIGGYTPVATVVSSTGLFTSSVTAQSSDARVTLVIPVNTVGLTRDGLAVSQIDIVQSIAPAELPPDSGVVGYVYDFGPEGATFNPAITLTMSYDPAAIPSGVAANKLIIAYYDTATGKWVNLTSTVNTAIYTVSALVSHFTAFTVLAYTPPAVFTLGSLTVAPAQVDVGVNVDISVVVSNTGGLSGTYSVALKINNVVLDTREVTLAGGTNQKVSFGVSRNAPGTYTVDVGGLTGSFLVRAPAVPLKPAAFTTGSLTISPAEANIGETVTISALVTNTGGQSGSYTVTLKINNILVTTQSVTLPGGANQKVTFTTTTLTTAGTYTVGVDNLSGTFT